MEITTNIHHVTKVEVETEVVGDKYGMSRLIIHFTDWRGNPQETRVTLFTDADAGILKIPFEFSEVREV